MRASTGSDLRGESLFRAKPARYAGFGCGKVWADEWGSALTRDLLEEPYLQYQLWSDLTPIVDVRSKSRQRAG